MDIPCCFLTAYVCVCVFFCSYHLATGSDDHTVRLWDMRKRETVITYAAHSKLISNVKFEPATGSALFSTSFDGVLKIWSTRECVELKRLAGHENYIMGLDVAPGSIVCWWRETGQRCVPIPTV